MHKYIPNTALRGISAALICLLLSNCASSPYSPQPRVDAQNIPTDDRVLGGINESSENEDTATPYAVDTQYNIERAEYYEQLANSQTATTDPIDSALSSAEYYVQANDYVQAQTTIDGLNINQLNVTQFNRFSIVQAYVEYSAGEYETALQRLSTLTKREDPQNVIDDNELTLTLLNPEPEIASIEDKTQKVDALLLSSFCYQQLNDFDAAISALIYRESFLVGNARAETARYTSQIISNLSDESRLSIINQTSDVLVRNRLEQSLDGQFALKTDLPSQFDQWRDTSIDANKQIIQSDWGPSSPKKIAVLLPLTSRYSKAAHAVMDGIEYKHNANNSLYKPTIDFYDVGTDVSQTSEYYSAISQMGYDLVIGPIGKDYANQLFSVETSQLYTGLPTILLGGDSDLNSQTGNSFSRLTLSPEADGIEVANHAKRQGYVSAALLVPDNEFGQRTSTAFQQQWLSQGGNISKVITYSPAQYDHTIELKQLFEINQSEYRHTRISNTLGLKPEFSAYRRSDVDFIFMVADNDSGRIVRPQINFFSGKTVPVYATSSIFNGIQDEVNNLDLEQTHFPVIPWVLQSTNIAPYAGQLNLLFAMGGDAYLVAANYHAMRNNPNIAITGNMGSLHFERSGNIVFQPVWAEFKQGLASANSALPKLQNLNLLPSENTNQPNETGLNSYNDSNWDSGRSSRKTGAAVP